jgi:hypothetical protein
MEKIDYYKLQVNKINFHLDYPAKVLFVDENNKTKFLDLNKESAKVIIDKLKTEFNID